MQWLLGAYVAREISRTSRQSTSVHEALPTCLFNPIQGQCVTVSESMQRILFEIHSLVVTSSACTTGLFDRLRGGVGRVQATGGEPGRLGVHGAQEGSDPVRVAPPAAQLQLPLPGGWAQLSRRQPHGGRGESRFLSGPLLTQPTVLANCLGCHVQFVNEEGAHRWN